MHICTIRGLHFQREPGSVDIYDRGCLSVAVTSAFIDSRDVVISATCHWLFPTALALMDALAGNTSNADIARVIVRAARAAGVKDEEIVVNPELREAPHA